MNDQRPTTRDEPTHERRGTMRANTSPKLSPLALVVLVAASAWWATPAFAQYPITGTGAGELIMVGLIRNPGTSQYRPAVCRADILTPLRSDSAWNESLNRDILVNGAGGNDTIYFVRNPQGGTAFTPQTNNDCGSSQWYAIDTFNGYTIDVDGSAGSDTIETGPLATPGRIYGDGDGSASTDYIYNYSSIADVQAGNGNDHIVSDTTGGSEHIPRMRSAPQILHGDPARSEEALSNSVLRSDEIRSGVKGHHM